MISAVHLDLSEKINYNFEIEVLSGIKSLFPEIITFDLDTGSDPSMLEHAIKLLQESDKAVVYSTASGNISPRLFTLFEEVLRNNQKYKLFLEGENPWIEKMFSALPANYLNRNLSLEEKLKATELFFKNGQ